MLYSIYMFSHYFAMAACFLGMCSSPTHLWPCIPPPDNPRRPAWRARLSACWRVYLQVPSPPQTVCVRAQLSACQKWGQRQTNQLNPGQLIFNETRTAALGGIRTHDTLQSRQVLCQLSYVYTRAIQLVGVESTTQHNTKEDRGKP